MEYKGYHAMVEFDEEAEVFHGRVIDIHDIITFEGESISALKKEFKVSIDEYLKFCSEKGVDPQKPYSGRFNLRIDSDLHRKLAIKAARENKSINELVSEVLDRAR